MLIKFTPFEITRARLQRKVSRFGKIIKLGGLITQVAREDESFGQTSLRE